MHGKRVKLIGDGKSETYLGICVLQLPDHIAASRLQQERIDLCHRCISGENPMKYDTDTVFCDLTTVWCAPEVGYEINCTATSLTHEFLAIRIKAHNIEISSNFTRLQLCLDACILYSEKETPTMFLTSPSAQFYVFALLP